jgi:hypothetical protein
MARAPFSPRSRRRVCQHVVRSTPWPASRRRLALRLAGRRDARCVGPISATITSTYQHPRLVGSRCRPGACALVVAGEIACSTAGDSLRRVARFPSCAIAAGVVFPSRRVRTEPLTPLSPPPVEPVTLARSWTSQGPPRPTPTRPRERACRRDGLECLPSIEDPRPATPFRAPGLGLPDTAAWPPRSRFTTPLGSRRSLRNFASFGPRPRAPLPAESALVWTVGFARRLLQPNSTRGHTLRAVDPRTRVDGLRPTARRHEQMPVA